ncbi:hypothetical protein ABNF97_32420 [Plantactinospora sp. B6F1]|uniref:hypothetical protein n=1 Tax=Plantactinospora sp. B6F1 TaxID=3158971 RepID=UPI0032D970A9
MHPQPFNRAQLFDPAQPFDRAQRPSQDAERQLHRLREELASCQQVMCEMQGRLNDARSRLAVIGRIARDDARCRRAPTVSWAAVRAALYCQPDMLDRIGPDLPRR